MSQMHLFTGPIIGDSIVVPKTDVTSGDAEHNKTQRKPRAMASPLPCQWLTLPCT